jgi:hypothetical protein
MVSINEITVYISTMLCCISCVQYSRTLQLASKIEYKIHPSDEGYQWIDDKSLYRLVLRLKLGIRLIMSILCLFVCLNRILPHLIVYQTTLIAYSSLLFFMCMCLDAQIMYLIYSRDDFKFLNITKKKNKG